MLIRRLFLGRTEVYPVRWEGKAGKTGYAPAQRVACRCQRITQDQVHWPDGGALADLGKAPRQGRDRGMEGSQMRVEAAGVAVTD